MSNEAREKPYPPSSKKLEDARKKGEIPRSTDLTVAGAYCGLLVGGGLLLPSAIAPATDALAAILARADALAVDVFIGSAWPSAGTVAARMAKGLWPLFLLPAAFAIFAVTLQRAWLVTPSKLAPKLSRISPIAGFKNKFGRQGLFEFLKSTTKLSVFCAVLAVFLSYRLDQIVGAIQLAPVQLVQLLAAMLVEVVFVVCVVALIIGAIDYSWQQAEHLAKNRMDRKELMDELKHAEGDPQIKQKRRQRAQEIANNQMLTDVPNADVVMVNPTHFAVALRWDPQTSAAPVCVAKGVDHLALKIREIAQENGVPIHHDPPATRALHASIDVGDVVREEHYKPVAAAIRFAQSLAKSKR